MDVVVRGCPARRAAQLAVRRQLLLHPVDDAALHVHPLLGGGLSFGLSLRDVQRDLIGPGFVGLQGSGSGVRVRVGVRGEGEGRSEG